MDTVGGWLGVHGAPLASEESGSAVFATSWQLETLGGIAGVGVSSARVPNPRISSFFFFRSSVLSSRPLDDRVTAGTRVRVHQLRLDVDDEA